jgi:hypothetical protein
MTTESSIEATTPSAPMPGVSAAGTGTDDAARARALHDQLQAAEAARDEAQRAQAGAEQNLQRFKNRVRATALDAKGRENWCDEGFNEAMRELDLPELIRSWTGTATVRVRVEDTSSEDVDDAARWVRDALSSTAADVEIVEIESISLDPEH